MLEGRTTFLKFDNHTSDAISINNGIGQGDPLSMVLYQFYNADILNIPAQVEEATIAYIDDALILAMAHTFERAHQILKDMMSRTRGVYEWSHSHNSPLEHSQLVLIDFAHRSSSKVRSNLTLPSAIIEPAATTKYLGVIIDQYLNWMAQHACTISKGSKWASQIRRITRPSWGVTPKYVQKLYISVALPRILYGSDIWYGPPLTKGQRLKNIGSTKVIRQLTSIQCSGAIAITGAFHTSLTDTLNVCAFLLPAILTVEG